MLKLRARTPCYQVQVRPKNVKRKQARHPSQGRHVDVRGGSMTPRIICNLMKRANQALYLHQNPGHGDVTTENPIQNMSHKVFWVAI